MERSLLLLGAGGHARSCIDVIEQTPDFGVYGLVGHPEQVGNEVLGYPVIGSDEKLAELLATTPAAIVTVGQIKSPDARIRLFQTIQTAGCASATVVSPRAYVSRHASIGAGTIVMHGAVVNAGAVVGDNCIINSQALVEHDAIVDDHCHVSTGALVNGGAHLGAGSFLGSGSVLREGVIIGTRCVIGMGRLVLTHCEPGTMLAGTLSV